MKHWSRIKNFRWFFKFFNEPRCLTQSSKHYRGGVVQFGGLSVKPRCLQGKLLLRTNIIFNSSFRDVCRYSQYVCRRKLCCAASLISWQGPAKNLTVSTGMYEPLFLKICRRMYELTTLFYIKYWQQQPKSVVSIPKLFWNFFCSPKSQKLYHRGLGLERSFQEIDMKFAKCNNVRHSSQCFGGQAAFPSINSFAKNSSSHSQKMRRKLLRKTKGLSKTWQNHRHMPKNRKFPSPLKTTVENLSPRIFSRPPLIRASLKPIPREKTIASKDKQIPANMPSQGEKGSKSIVIPINTVIRKHDRRDLIEFDRRIYKAYYANKESSIEKQGNEVKPTHLKVSVPTQSLSKDGEEMSIESLNGNMELYFKEGKRVFTISKKDGSNPEIEGQPVVNIQVEGGKLTNSEYVPGMPVNFTANLVGSVSVKLRGVEAANNNFSPELVKGKVDAFMNQVCQFLILSSMKETDNLDFPILAMSAAKDCTPCSGSKDSKPKSTDQKQPPSKSVCEQILKKELEAEPMFPVKVEPKEKSGSVEESRKLTQSRSENNTAKPDQCGGKEVRPKVSQCNLKGIQRAIEQTPKDTRICPDIKQVICKELRGIDKPDKKCCSSSSESINGRDCIKPMIKKGEKPKCATSPTFKDDKKASTTKCEGTTDADILKKVAKTIPTQKTVIKFVNPSEVCFEKAAIPPLRDNEVLVKMDTIGICLADIHMYETGISHYNGEEIPLGHEGSGTVIQVGSKVKRLKFGDKVAIEPSEACGRCSFCQSGRKNLCQETKFAGVMSDYSVHCENCCHKLPLGVTLEQGALAYPLSLAIHACRLGCISLGSKVLVIGACPVGISAIMCARAMGAKDIAIVDSEEANLKIAKCVGANNTIQIDTNAKTEALCQELSCLMDCRPNIVIDSCGSTKSIDLSTNVIQPGGVNVVVGCQEENPVIPMLASLVKELVIKTSFRSYNTYPLALEMIRNGTANVEKLITHRFEFCKAKEGFETALNETKCKALKVVLKFPKN